MWGQNYVQIIVWVSAFSMNARRGRNICTLTPCMHVPVISSSCLQDVQHDLGQTEAERALFWNSLMSLDLINMHYLHA